MKKFKHVKTGLFAEEKEFYYELHNNCGDVKEIPKCIVEGSQDWKIFFEVGTKIKDNTYGNIITKTEDGWSSPWENNAGFVDRGIGSRFSLVEDNLIGVNAKISTLHWVTDKDTLIKYDKPTQAWPKGFKKDYNSDLSEDEFIKTYLESGLWRIHTIICGDKSFSIGDRIIWDWSTNDVKYFTIKSFQESAKHEIEFSPEEHDYESWFSINSLSKSFDLSHYKEPLFKTYDEVEIYKGDEYFYVVGGEIQAHSWKVYPHTCNWNNIDLIPLGYWQFSKKENAEAYILRNKPCLSVEEVLDALEEFPRGAKWEWDRTCSGSVNKLEGLVQKKVCFSAF